MSIYKSAQGRTAVLDAYDQSLARLGVELEERMVPTRHGQTHVLVRGPEDGPPLLLFHGGNSFNAFILRTFLPLADTYRLYSPDIVGHPGRSAETRLSSDDLGYGEWARDVMASLGLESAHVVGASFGAGVALRLAAVAPERVAKMALLVPSGFVMPPAWNMTVKLLWPWLIHAVSPSQAHLDKMLAPLFAGGEIDSDLARDTGVVMLHYRTIRDMPRPATTEELAAYQAPTLVVAGEHDIMFPAALVGPKADQVLANLTFELLEGSGHEPGRARRGEIVERFRDFLGD